MVHRTRTTLRAAAAALAALAGAAALPAVASADLDLSRDGGLVRGLGDRPDLSEADVLTVVDDGATLRFVPRSTGTLLNAGDGCVQDDDEVTCGDAATARIDLRLGPGADEVAAAGFLVNPTDVPMTIRGGSGADRIAGGRGLDLVDFSDAPGTVTAVLPGDGQTVATVAGGASDTLRAVEGLAGGPVGDTLTGDAGPNRLLGDRGNDTLEGLGGDDDLEGADGNDRLRADVGTDRLRGGAGNDRLDALDAAADPQVDCGTGDDDAIADLLRDAPTACEVLAPEVDVAPAITGSAVENQVLAAADGRFRGTAPAITRAWSRCNADRTGCVPAGGAPTLPLRRADVGKVVRLDVTAANRAGQVRAEPVFSAVVAPIPVPAAIPLPPGLAATFADVGRVRAVRRGGRYVVQLGEVVACQAGGAPCTVRVAATGRTPPTRRRRARRLTMGTATTTVAAGQSAPLALRLSPAATAALRRAQSLALRFTVLVLQPGAVDAAEVFTATVRAPRSR